MRLVMSVVLLCVGESETDPGLGRCHRMLWWADRGPSRKGGSGRLMTPLQVLRDKLNTEGCRVEHQSAPKACHQDVQ
ncbi:hypothetical protein EYF80_027560 [Liparis tanakae]|uniref:Uncharacterized protein n=1 Tax=Liparis tanakae TaxID=230148 RepID=A0A4Z2H9I8_9TELE|nr:hypothetical protein EYF80_027560 [Liparis tanakae]